jgi:hypothetical protein
LVLKVLNYSCANEFLVNKDKNRRRSFVYILTSTPNGMNVWVNSPWPATGLGHLSHRVNLYPRLWIMVQGENVGIVVEALEGGFFYCLAPKFDL